MKLKLSLIVLLTLMTSAASLSWAQEQSQQEAIQQAADFYLKKIRSDPSNLALHRELVDTFNRRGMVFIPVSIYRNALEKNDSQPIVLYVLGYAYLMAAGDPIVTDETPDPLPHAEANLKAFEAGREE